MPDVAVAAVLLDAIDDGLDRMDLIWAHHHELALGLDQNHVAADHLGQGAFGQKDLDEIVMGQMPCLSSPATKLFHPMTNRDAKFLSGVFLVPGRSLSQGKRKLACRMEIGNLSGGGPEFPRRQP